jgi:hypothetical protein
MVTINVQWGEQRLGEKCPSEESYKSIGKEGMWYAKLT